MSQTILTMEIRFEQDVVMTRQRARQIAQALGFDGRDLTHITTAVSEITRNAFQYAKGGKVEFGVEEKPPQSFSIRIRDRGPGIPNLKTILDGQYVSTTGMGLGIIGTKRLMDWFGIESVPGRGTTVLMRKTLPRPLTASRLVQIADELVRHSPRSPFEEIQAQNQELLRALEALQQREAELTQLNRELEDTNRGVVALYAELDEKAVSLQRANELKTRFFSNMSHEFRTPLNSIISLSRLLLDRMDGELTAEQEKQVSFIRRSAEGLSELVNDLLDMAKVEAGKIVVYPSKFEMNDLFSALRGMLRPLLAYNSSISLVFEAPVGMPILYTDEGKVAQILRNFISNALKYTERGEVRVAAVMNGNTVIFSVTDTGIGIAPEDTERIFEEYIQIDSPVQRRLKGTGLGLSLSRKLAQLLGGSVSVTSKLGIGSTFFAAIPLAYPGLGDMSIPPFCQLDPSRSAVLVVEDNIETLFTYEKYFERSIYQFIPARSLEEAKQAMRMFEPVAIVSDVLLEGQHTWTFISDLKRDAATQNIPIFVVTVIDNEAKAMALGADAFSIKPVDRLLFLNKLNILVKKNKEQKLLLINRDRVDRSLLEESLKDTHLAIVEAGDGPAGIALAQVEKPSCIILDFSLAVNGIHILDRLQGNPGTSNIPIIGYASELIEAEQQVAERTIAILSENLSYEVAVARLREALIKAGIAFKDTEIDHA